MHFRYLVPYETAFSFASDDPVDLSHHNSSSVHIFEMLEMLKREDASRGDSLIGSSLLIYEALNSCICMAYYL